MPTLPNVANTDRVLDAAATAAQTEFVISWPVFADSETAAAHDIEVLIDGEVISTDDFTFVGTSISGISGVWNGGTVVLDSPCSGGERVIIASDRRPRRVGSFLEGRSLPFTELDKLMDDVVVQLRDLDFRVKRALMLSASDLLDGMSGDLGDGASRANKGLGFGPDGNLAFFDNSMGPEDAANLSYLAPFTNALSRTVRSRLSDLVSVKDFGASAGGISDDRAALVKADAVGSTIFLPKGVYRVSSNLTLSSNLQFVAGAILKPANGVTITINGHIFSGPNQIFDLSLGGLVRGKACDAYPDWWGALRDGETDGSAAWQAANDYLEAAGGGTIALHYGMYEVNSAEVTLGANVHVRGKSKWLGLFINGDNVDTMSAVSNSGDNHTLHFSGLNNTCKGVVFLGNEPIFQCGSVNADGTLSLINARYPGRNLTPGTYALVIDGGHGVGAAGTVTVGSDGKVDHCTLTNAGSSYFDAGPLGLPRVTAPAIPGAVQQGAHIFLTGGSEWAVEDCAFFSKDFQILCNYNHVVKSASASFLAGGNQVIGIANTSGLTVGMIANDLDNPYSIAQLSQISGITPSTSVTMVYPLEAASAGNADRIVFGDWVYFVFGKIKGCSFYGGSKQIYGNWAAESMIIEENFFVNPKACPVFAYSAICTVWRGNNIDGLFMNRAVAAQFLSMPSNWGANAIGNITGPIGAAYLMSGRLVFGGTLVPSCTMGGGDSIYAPCPMGFDLRNITKALFNPSYVSVTGLAADRHLKSDATVVGNTFIQAADIEPLESSLWEMASQQNTIIGTRGIQLPYVRVAADYVAKWYDHTIEVDALAADVLVTLPSPASGTFTKSFGGLEFDIFKSDGSGHAVNLYAGGANINDTTASLMSPFALTTNYLGGAKLKYGASSEWFTLNRVA